MDASQSLTLRAPEIDAAARLQLPIIPGVTVVATVLGPWLVNFADWSFDDTRAIVAVCAASLVATSAIAAGWASEPDEPEQWAIRGGAAAFNPGMIPDKVLEEIKKRYGARTARFVVLD